MVRDFFVLPIYGLIRWNFGFLEDDYPTAAERSDSKYTYGLLNYGHFEGPGQNDRIWANDWYI